MKTVPPNERKPRVSAPATTAPAAVLPDALAGKGVLVVGGGSGIGRAAAELLAGLGARVTAASRSLAAGDAPSGGVPAIRRAPVDVTDEAALRALVEDAGELDHVLVTAGEFLGGPVAELPADAVRRTLLSRTEDALRVARVAAPRLRPGGSLTFTSASGAVRPLPGTAATVASVAGLEGLVRALAIELAPVRVNAVRPGPTDTPMLRGFLPEPTDAAVAAFGAGLPLGRVARPEEVAAAALFLMANPYATGSIVAVDGGTTLV